MNSHYFTKIAAELSLRPAQVEATAALLAEGGTVPFIARYRKERTGELDEVAITAVRDRLTQLLELDQRRAAIIESLKERELLTDELAEKIAAAESMAVLEDIYLPFRPKRRTRAMIARERGLEPLAERIFAQNVEDAPNEIAADFVDIEKDVADAEAALAGARDIIAEWVNENAEARAEMRAVFESKAIFSSKVVTGKETEGIKFRDYFEASENAAKMAGHRILAMFRGEKEGVLSLNLRPDRDEAVELLQRRFVSGASRASEQVAQAVQDSYARLMATSMEVELRANLRKRADEEAIGVFSANLRELLLAPALGQKTVLAIDPGIRTGCKVACLDAQGKLLFDTVIQLSQSDYQRREAAGVIVALCRKFNIEAIAIGNGTYGRETEAFVRSLELSKEIVIVQVNESGASIYSASEVARQEFPDKDVTVRGSVSIGRRLMDPLSELVKIDPKSIGVGQYQHDVDQGMLKNSLDDVVISCVNLVGVEVNTASAQLLGYVSGLGPSLAANVVKHRDEHGAFESRDALRAVPRLGPKAFEQCAGFLRVHGAENPLDASAVHPERYELVERMARDLGCAVADLMKDSALRDKIEIERYVGENVGLPTLRDIVEELAKPGRDPRKAFEAFSFAEGVNTIQDVRQGMKLPGIVTNVTKFGAFVNIGVHQDGLVHLSELSDRFVTDPGDVVKVGQQVEVTVLEVDEERQRIGLSMKSVPGSRRARGGQAGADDRIQDGGSGRDGGRPGGQGGRSLGRRGGSGESSRGSLGRRDDRRGHRGNFGSPPPAFGNPFADAFSEFGKK